MLALGMLVNWLCSELCPVHPCTHSSPTVVQRRSSPLPACQGATCGEDAALCFLMPQQQSEMLCAVLCRRSGTAAAWPRSSALRMQGS